ncbi:MAG TPA: multifunctional CCA tRNA nucleotidyl transferase/2'3'-cyclic phosphodiesterase/2'nucleotidase/phosphatase [Burkholderiales bacterium]|nr:multifunctional CCA tRNA nucleotidyl transferase/2'3'-cyclic phosphodiesterase/2'nucleotidase/phosphatase [Burkholderiales bacterium]
MKTYVVGGAVRDELLGLPVQDRDYVVVGATPEEMVAAGFQPVGKDFPVFLHPQTHEEYALARTERKSGRGYKGFTVHAAPDVTLEDDLRRRDLTINAIAKDPETGELVDPFHGRKDLREKVLRHVSEAFVEDPVRILRVARFAARFGFDVAPETKALMRQMVASGEADALVPERVWQEFAKGLVEEQPEKMLAVLEDAGLRSKLLPGIDMGARLQGSLPVRFALLTWKLQENAVEDLSENLKAPNEVRELAVVAARVRRILRERNPAPEALLELLKRADAFRRAERFDELLSAARVAEPAFDAARIDAARRAALDVDAGAIARANPPERVARAIDEARLAAIARSA